jgi:hypothetical protein
MKALLIIFSFYVVGCTCSNEVETPRDVSKEPHGSVKFINVSDREIDIRCYYNEYESSYRGGRTFLSSLDTDPSTLYNDIPIGGIALQMKRRSGESIANIPFLFKDGAHHSIVLYGNGSEKNVSFFADDLYGTRNGKVYIRCINYSPDSSDVTFTADSNQIVDAIEYTENSRFIEVDSLTTSVSVNGPSGKIDIPITMNYPFKHLSVIVHTEISGKRYSLIEHD